MLVCNFLSVGLKCFQMKWKFFSFFFFFLYRGLILYKTLTNVGFGPNA